MPCDNNGISNGIMHDAVFFLGGGSILYQYSSVAYISRYDLWPSWRLSVRQR